MTVLLLVRHGSTDAVGKVLTGRLPGYPLNDLGRAEARALAEALAELELDAIYSSPLERAVGTAVHLADARGLKVVVREALTDIDFGTWSARSISELESVPAFRQFNGHRAFCSVPEGERVVGVQARMVDALAAIAGEHPSGTAAVVSHCDPIRLALAFYLGVSIDHAHRFEIGTGSVSALELTEHDAKLLYLNLHSGNSPARERRPARATPPRA